MATQIYSDNLIIIQLRRNATGDFIKQLHKEFIEMRKSGVMVIPSFCDVVYIEKETEWQQS